MQMYTNKYVLVMYNNHLRAGQLKKVRKTIKPYKKIVVHK